MDGSKGEHRNFDAYDASFVNARGIRPLTLGEIGCAASHVGIWRRCVLGGQAVVVMEDDLILGPRFAEAMVLAENALATYPFVRLGGVFERPTRQLTSSGSGLELVRFTKGPAGTGCYMVAPAAASALLATLKPLTVPIDDYLDMFWIHGVKSIGVMPFQISAEGYDSTISDTRWKFRPSNAAKLRREIVRAGHILRRHMSNLSYALGEKVGRNR